MLTGHIQEDARQSALNQGFLPRDTFQNSPWSVRNTHMPRDPVREILILSASCFPSSHNVCSHQELVLFNPGALKNTRPRLHPDPLNLNLAIAFLKVLWVLRQHGSVVEH